jgi:hypothetical protein
MAKKSLALPDVTVKDVTLVGWKDLVEASVSELEWELEQSEKKLVSENNMLHSELEKLEDEAYDAVETEVLKLFPGSKPTRTKYDHRSISFSCNYKDNNMQSIVDIQYKKHYLTIGINPTDVIKPFITKSEVIYTKLQAIKHAMHAIENQLNELPKLTRRMRAATLQQAIAKTQKGKDIMDYFKSVREEITESLVKIGYKS